MKVKPATLIARLAGAVFITPSRTLANQTALQGVRCYRSTDGIVGIGFGATDTDNGITVGPVSDSWVLVSGRQLLACLNTLRHEECIEWQETPTHLKLVGKSGQFELALMDPSTHPSPIQDLKGEVLRYYVGAGDLAGGVGRVRHAISRSDRDWTSKTGITLFTGAVSLSIGATDGNRAASTFVELKQVDSGAVFLQRKPVSVQPLALEAIARIPAINGLVKIEVGESKIRFSVSDAIVESELNLVTHSDIMDYWPKKPTVSTVNRAEFLAALRCAATTADPGERRVKVRWGKRIVLSSSQANGSCSQAIVSGKVEGSPVESYCMHQALSDFLKAASPAETVAFHASRHALGLIAPVGFGLRGLVLPAA